MIKKIEWEPLRFTKLLIAKRKKKDKNIL